MSRSICDLEDACSVNENGRWHCDNAGAWLKETEEMLNTLDEAAGMVDCSVKRDELKVWMVNMFHAFARLMERKYRRSILPGFGSEGQQSTKLQSGDLCISPFGHICIVVDDNSGFANTITLNGKTECTVSRTEWASVELSRVCSYSELASLVEFASDLKSERSTGGKEGKHE